MPLYIAGVLYSEKTDIEKALAAVIQCHHPRKLPNVAVEFDEKYCSIIPNSDNPDFLATYRDEDKLADFLKKSEIPNKNGKNFSVNPERREEIFDVPQGNIAFITNKIIGTTNVQDCVALIVQDKASKKTALAHLTSMSFACDAWLNAAISTNMPKEEKEVILIGGSHNSGRENVKRILGQLIQHPDILTINCSYVCDNSYIVYSSSRQYKTVSCYALNTCGGNIIVDCNDLSILTGRPACPLPEHTRTRAPYNLYDLDTVEPKNLNTLGFFAVKEKQQQEPEATTSYLANP